MSERKSRFLESRAAESRSMEMQRMPNPSFKGRLYINPEIIPDDIVVGWFYKTSMNEPDWQNIKNKMTDGWEIAPPEMFPTLQGPDMTNFFGPSENRYIERYGCILMFMPKEKWKNEERYQNEETRAAMQQANVASSFLTEDPRMPFTTLHDQTHYGGSF